MLLILIVLMVTSARSMPKAQAKGFPDVDESDWYYKDLMKLVNTGIISGYPDGTFKPGNKISRGEFIHMVVMVAEIWTDKVLTGVSWAESDWHSLNDAGILDISTGPYSQGDLFPCTAAALNAPITRYEMSYIINGVLYSAYYEKQMELKNPSDSYANYISDYGSMDKSYQGPVEQVFSKGIITGDENASFNGGNQLTRAESAAVIVRLTWSVERKAQTFAQEKAVETVAPTTSFAFRYRTMTNTDRRLALFGNPNKTHFTSPADAGNHVVNIKVPTWDINAAGAKYTRTWDISVNALVVDELKSIFEEIYNSAERFPIHALGGARYSDNMRHSWGCAIDINPMENYYIHYATGQTVGKFCWKNGSSPYCITPDSSVVKAFAKYGWGWGGQGWTSAADYMHFSILANGG